MAVRLASPFSGTTRRRVSLEHEKSKVFSAPSVAWGASLKPWNESLTAGPAEMLGRVFDISHAPPADRSATVPERPVAAASPPIKRWNQSQTTGAADMLRLGPTSAALRPPLWVAPPSLDISVSFKNTARLMAEPRTNELMEKIVSLCKRRGFIFQSSEIYGGING